MGCQKVSRWRGSYIKGEKPMVRGSKDTQGKVKGETIMVKAGEGIQILKGEGQRLKVIGQRLR